MRVSVKLFARLRDLAGTSDLEERFDGDAVTISEFARRLGEHVPALQPQLDCVAFAVNEEYIPNHDTAIHDGDVVALIPPVSGGSDDADRAAGSDVEACPPFLVTEAVLDRTALRDLVCTPASGAVVLFEGVVRDHHEGHTVLRLEYEAYPSMAEKQLEAVAAEVISEYAGREVYSIAAHHRIGTLEIGDISLLVAVSAAHRRDAFEAALRVVDRIKETVPVWKKEYGPNGATWQEGVMPLLRPNE
ncbi:MAG: hypothetical protein DWI59_03310 [Chloroflexi bacterium]|nr:MAG: hypothetical protein DWI59_03310 [Chloroflexota bacterium]